MGCLEHEIGLVGVKDRVSQTNYATQSGQKGELVRPIEWQKQGF